MVLHSVYVNGKGGDDGRRIQSAANQQPHIPSHRPFYTCVGIKCVFEICCFIQICIDTSIPETNI